MTITGDQIQSWRKQRKLSRAAFAELIGSTPSKVQSMEGGRAPRPAELERLLAVMGDEVPSMNGAATPIEPLPGMKHMLRAVSSQGAVTRCGMTVPPDDSTSWESEVTCPACAGTPIAEAQPSDIVIEGDEDESDEDAWIVVDGDPDQNVWDYLDATGERVDQMVVVNGPLTEVQGTVTANISQPVWTEITSEPDRVPSLIEPGPEHVSTDARLFSNSELQTWKRCKRKWWLSWYRLLRLEKEMPLGARAIGTWVHEALSRYYVPPDMPAEDPVSAINEILNAVQADLLAALAQQAQEDNDGGFQAERLMQLHRRDAELARAMVEGYVEWLAETGADEGLTVVGSEQYIEADLAIPHDVPVKIIGKLDARFHREHDDTRWFADHKTVGNLATPIKTIHMNEQMLHYMTLERAQPDEAPVVGALYNMLRKVKRTAQATPPFYQRVEVRHNPQELENYLAHLRGVVPSILSAEAQLDRGADPHNVCYPTFAPDCAYMCDFYAVCTMFDDGSRAEDMVAQVFKVGTRHDYYEDALKSEAESD